MDAIQKLIHLHVDPSVLFGAAVASFITGVFAGLYVIWAISSK